MGMALGSACGERISTALPERYPPMNEAEAADLNAGVSRGRHAEDVAMAKGVSNHTRLLFRRNRLDLYLLRLRPEVHVKKGKACHRRGRYMIREYWPQILLR